MPGVLPRLAGVPDVAKLERELRDRLTRIELGIEELKQMVRDVGKPLDDRGT